MLSYALIRVEERKKILLYKMLKTHPFLKPIVLFVLFPPNIKQ